MNKENRLEREYNVWEIICCHLKKWWLAIICGCLCAAVLGGYQYKSNQDFVVREGYEEISQITASLFVQTDSDESFMERSGTILKLVKSSRAYDKFIENTGNELSFQEYKDAFEFMNVEGADVMAIYVGYPAEYGDFSIQDEKSAVRFAEGLLETILNISEDLIGGGYVKVLDAPYVTNRTQQLQSYFLTISEDEFRKGVIKGIVAGFLIGILLEIVLYSLWMSNRQRKEGTKAVSTFLHSDWEKIGIVSFYGYFAINILMKAFSYDHGDNIYRYFLFSAMMFWAIKMVTTRYTMREVMWMALLLGTGLMLSVITKQNTWLLLFLTVIGMKNCRFRSLVQIAVCIRTFSAIVLVLGSVYGVYDIGFKTAPDTKYVEIPVYSFAMNEPNTAFLAIFLTLGLLLYYNYEKLNKWWFVITSIIAFVFYKLTFCRTGIAVFFFCWGLIIFDKVVKNHKAKSILAFSVPVGAVFSLITMVFYDGGNSLLRLMNHFVSGRIYIMNSYFRELGISLFPRTQETFYAHYHGLIDNTYMFVFLYCGVIVAFFFFGLVCVTLYRLYQGGHYKELVMIASMALYGVLEQYVMNGFMNVFILLCGILLYPGLMGDEERDIKQEVNMQEG